MGAGFITSQTPHSLTITVSSSIVGAGFTTSQTPHSL
jgi:hypothetical protein